MSAEGLAALQARFQAYVLQAHVLQGDGAALADVRSVVGSGAAQRLGIYHHAYRARLLETLRDSFGHTLLYLGDRWFDSLAQAFIEATPSVHPNLRFYGEGLADWLAQPASPLADHPEVAELARLDWALRHAFDAADAPVLDLAALSGWQAEDWDTVVLRPQPSARLLVCHSNTLSLWHALDQDAEPPEAVRLPQPMVVLVWRQAMQPHFRSVSPQEAVALTGLMQHQPFAALCALLAARFAHEDTTVLAGQCLRRWVDEGLLTMA